MNDGQSFIILNLFLKWNVCVQMRKLLLLDDGLKTFFFAHSYHIQDMICCLIDASSMIMNHALELIRMWIRAFDNNNGADESDVCVFATICTTKSPKSPFPSNKDICQLIAN